MEVRVRASVGFYLFTCSFNLKECSGSAVCDSSGLAEQTEQRVSVNVFELRDTQTSEPRSAGVKETFPQFELHCLYSTCEFSWSLFLFARQLKLEWKMVQTLKVFELTSFWFWLTPCWYFSLKLLEIRFHLLSATFYQADVDFIVCCWFIFCSCSVLRVKLKYIQMTWSGVGGNS